MQRRIFIDPTSHMNNYRAAAVPTFSGMARKVPSTTPSVYQVQQNYNVTAAKLLPILFQCPSCRTSIWSVMDPTLGKVVTAAGHLSFWTYLV